MAGFVQRGGSYVYDRAGVGGGDDQAGRRVDVRGQTEGQERDGFPGCMNLRLPEEAGGPIPRGHSGSNAAMASWAKREMANCACYVGVQIDRRLRLSMAEQAGTL